VSVSLMEVNQGKALLTEISDDSSSCFNDFFLEYADVSL
jgi:hypothetical protein